MDILLLKLIMAPVILGTASLAGRRWGAMVSGWLVGLPLTSGPVVFFLAISHDTGFALNATLGVLSGGISLVIYTLIYAWLAIYFRWPVAIICSLVAFSLSTAILQNFVFSLAYIFLVVVVLIIVALYAMPRAAINAEHEIKPGRWDIPSRILVGTSFILLLTGVAPWIGPRLTGLLATIPLYITILTVFAHLQQGSASAVHVLRGLLYGMFAFAGFFLVLGLLIEKASLAASFGTATLISLGVQGLTLLILKHPFRAA
jgi:hypothetical protein